MFPSLDSWDANKLENVLALIKVVGLVALVVGFTAGLWWTEFHERLSDRLAQLKETAAQAELAETKQLASEAKLLMPKTTGFLTPGDGPTPILPPMPDWLAKKLPDTVTYLFFGNILACTDEFPFTLIEQRGESMIELDRKDGNLLLSAKVFDDKEDVMCHIVGNEFQINPNNVFKFKRDSPNHLAVVDFKLKHILDFEYINPHAIRFVGDFHLRGGGSDDGHAGHH